VFHEEAVIDGDIATIWATLADLPAYADWNPWLVQAKGELKPGGTVWALVTMQGGAQMWAEHTVLVVEPNARLCWRDAGWNSLFVYGQRCRTLRAREDGKVFFQQDLLLDGPLAHFASLTTGPSLRAGMAAETAALKQRIEAARP
jgi:hypothetical protein